MKKALGLLSGLLFVAGCGGFYPQLNQHSLYPVPVQLHQELSLLPVDRGDIRPLDLSGRNLESKVQAQGDPPLETDAAINFCSRDEPSPSFRAQGEDGLQDGIWISEIPRFSAWREVGDFTVENSPPEMKFPPASAELEKGLIDTFLSVASGGLKGEQAEGNPSAGTPPNENFKESPTLSASRAMGDVGDLSPEAYPPLQLNGQFPALHDPEGDTQKPFSEEKTPPNLLASFPTLLNEKVKAFIDFFQTRADTFLTNSLARSQAYEGMMKKIFREKNLPEELFYLALIESGFDPYAQSSAKACGIWQFMSKTAKRFGLKVDKWVDERRDPEKSTYAAAEYLKNLHDMFNCWYLATASYNAGEGKILQAMKRSNSQDFWEISKHRYLKRETKEYVPMFLAALIIAQDPGKYGFSRIDYHPPLLYEKVAVPPGTRLDRIARAAETDIAEVRTLNPSLRRDKTPPDGTIFELKLPPGKKEVFQNNFFKTSKFDLLNAKKHPVRRGETLGLIAKKYRVSLQELCEFNQLSPKNPIKPGLTLLVPP